jgi:hypothetical protein
MIDVGGHAIPGGTGQNKRQRKGGYVSVGVGPFMFPHPPLSLLLGLSL